METLPKVDVWSKNHIYVFGTPENTHNFATMACGFIEESEFHGELVTKMLDFEAFVPMPKALKSRNVAAFQRNQTVFTPGDFMYVTWLQWVKENWGTPWNPDLDTVRSFSNEDAVVHYRFRTMDAPPITWVRIVSSMFPLLEFYLTFETPRWSSSRRYIRGREQ